VPLDSTISLAKRSRHETWLPLIFLVWLVLLGSAPEPAKAKGLHLNDLNNLSDFENSRNSQSENNVKRKKNLQSKSIKMKEATTDFETLDVQRITIDDPDSAIKKFRIVKPDKTIRCDVLIAGGGVGGVAAALRLTKGGDKIQVCLTEETEWLGGQMTAQGVCALDENPLVETTGACLSYQQFRLAIRNHYKSTFKLSARSQEELYFNPGNCWVSRLAFEPKIAVQEIDELLSEAVSGGHLQIFKRFKIVHLVTKAGAVKSALAIDLGTGQSIEFVPKLCLDATELGDLLPLSGLAYSTGSDSRAVTGEPHAPEFGDADNVQDFVYPFVVDFKTGTDNSIVKPTDFDDFNIKGKFSFNGYKMFADSIIHEKQENGNEPEQRAVLPFWTYRRLIDKTAFVDALFPFDIAMINWDSNDLRGHNIIDKPLSVQANRLAIAKSLSLGFLYWLQNEAARDEGGNGYKELALRTDVLGTADGLSMYPYIREARRVRAKQTIVEQDIVAATNPGARARLFNDSVGIGQYFVDIHGFQEIPGTGQATRPFQIPMSALIPISGGNLLPACKNLGVTHITNGAYRLHPVEWAIGEAQGALAEFCIKHKVTPEKVLDNKKYMRQLQRAILEKGAPVFWFDDLLTDDPNFAAAQYASVSGLITTDANSLHFQPEGTVSIKEVAFALVKILGLEHGEPDPAVTTAPDERKARLAVTGEGAESIRRDKAIDICFRRGIFSAIPNAEPTLPITQRQLEEISRNHPHLPRYENVFDGERNVTRAQFAAWLWHASKNY
jgi:hypothetical protein